MGLFNWLFGHAEASREETKSAAGPRPNTPNTDQRLIASRRRTKMPRPAQVQQLTGAFDEAIRWQTQAVKLSPEDLKSARQARLQIVPGRPSVPGMTGADDS